MRACSKATLVGVATLALASLCTPSYGAGTFTLVYQDSFNESVPLGAFSGCAGDGDFKCAGLQAAHPHYYDTLGAYPDGWPDTATQRGYAQGGYYRPQSTISVIKSSSGDGQLEVKMTSERTTNKVAAVVPRPCMNLRYGKFSERFIVRTRTPGFKMAHLRYTPNEVDYPEAGGDFSSDPISAFTHGFAESGADVAPSTAWTGWHSYSFEVMPGQIKFYYDNALVQTVDADFPDAADWILQNESALNNVQAPAGSSVTIDTTWVGCYKYGG